MEGPVDIDNQVAKCGVECHPTKLNRLIILEEETIVVIVVVLTEEPLVIVDFPRG
jgi:hypothetical protein